MPKRNRRQFHPAKISERAHKERLAGERALLTAVLFSIPEGIVVTNAVALRARNNEFELQHRAEDNGDVRLWVKDLRAVHELEHEAPRISPPVVLT